MTSLDKATQTRWAAVAMREADLRIFQTLVSHLRGHAVRSSLDERTESAIYTLSNALHERWRRDVLDLLLLSSVQPSKKHRAAIAELVNTRFLDDESEAVKRQVLHFADFYGEHPSMWMSEDEDELRDDIRRAVQEVIGNEEAA